MPSGGDYMQGGALVHSEDEKEQYQDGEAQPDDIRGGGVSADTQYAAARNVAKVNKRVRIQEPEEQQGPPQNRPRKSVLKFS